ncbi:AMP-binding protein [Actinacidiphila acididurans]|uniref:AMP-binding protein n=1 Tax=Actinacidiphila acididurans TaxID=2784346 RepID=A0ABS2TU26_9ACTN|nr:AMP-binding protein [Actinacidiphila acididurans]MBM9506833.1 AMP-binding protein [Actinacidiphila acididurans]
MTDDAWNALLHGGLWRSPRMLWVEDDTEYSARRVDDLASAVEAAIAAAVRADGPVRVIRIRSDAKLGCFAGQLAAWRAGCVAVADDGGFGPEELDHVRPDLALTVTVTGDSWSVAAEGAADRPSAGRAANRPGTDRAAGRTSTDRIPAEVVAVNFTSGSTGSRKAVAVTRGNLLALFACRGLDVPAATGRLTSGSFARPAYDGWWFDTWRTVAADGTVVCLPGVNEDVFAWPDLARTYGIDRVLLPAAVVATLVAAVPEAIAGIPWLFSGGEQFQVSTYRRARQAGLRNHFVNLYGPTEATFATHRYELPEVLTTPLIPIGRPLDGCRQTLRTPEGDRNGHGDADHPSTAGRELVVAGPLVCLGYLAAGTLAHRFAEEDGERAYHTGDLVSVDDAGDLVFAGRLDSRIKVNGTRVDAAALEQEVAALPGVLDCRVVQDAESTVAFVRTAAPGADTALASLVEPVVKGFSPAIRVRLTDSFPTKSGGKVDTRLLMARHRATEEGGER